MHHGNQFEEEEFLGRVDQRLCQFISQYSEGRLHETVLAQHRIQGQSLRPKLIFHLGCIWNVKWKKLADWAVSCEMLHQASLVRDDLQDGGAAKAVNTGDFLMLLAPKAILSGDFSDGLSRQLMHLFSRMALGLTNAQSLESELVEVDKVEQMSPLYSNCITQRTSSLFAGAALGVGKIAGLGAHGQLDLERVFRLLGQTHRIQRDILDLWTDRDRGPVDGEMTEGKINFLIVKHLTDHPEDFVPLRTILRKRPTATTQEEARFVRNLMIEKGTLSGGLTDLVRCIKEVKSEPFVEGCPPLRESLVRLMNEMLQPVRHLRIADEPAVPEVFQDYRERSA